MAKRAEAGFPGVGNAAEAGDPQRGYQTNIGRVLVALVVVILTFAILYYGFLFLRDTTAPKIFVAVIAIVWGVGGVALLFTVANWLVEGLGTVWRARIQPFIFLGPAIAILLWIVFGASLCVVFGLMIAVLADRSKFENVAKSVIFMPMAISMVGASIIFGLLYALQPTIGLLNAIYTGLTGQPPIGWLASA